MDTNYIGLFANSASPSCAFVCVQCTRLTVMRWSTSWRDRALLLREHLIKRMMRATTLLSGSVVCHSHAPKRRSPTSFLVSNSYLSSLSRLVICNAARNWFSLVLISLCIILFLLFFTGLIRWTYSKKEKSVLIESSMCLPSVTCRWLAGGMVIMKAYLFHWNTVSNIAIDNFL